MPDSLRPLQLGHPDWWEERPCASRPTGPGHGVHRAVPGGTRERPTHYGRCLRITTRPLGVRRACSANPAR